MTSTPEIHTSNFLAKTTISPSPSIIDSRLPELAGGWERRTVDVGWTSIELANPVDPDSLLANETVLAANRQDDYMPYWATLWPAATQMATALEQATWREGTRVLEVGCGLGLVGLAGLKRGWDVTMTDYESKALWATKVNAELNGYSDISTAVLDWREPPRERYQVILACDVLYERYNHEPVLRLIKQGLDQDGRCWLGDPGRTPIVEFVHTALDAEFGVVIRSIDGDVQSFPARGQFQILEITPPDDPP